MARKRDRKVTVPAVRLELELVYIPDKARRISAPQPAWNVVRISAGLPGRSLVLREWNFCEDHDGKTLAESNEANWTRAKALYEQTAGQLLVGESHAGPTGSTKEG